MSEITASYIKLGIASLLPVFASILFYLLEKKTSFGKINKWASQIIIGIVFGGLAIIGTEWGIPMNGATVNCRDSAVLCAGLLFGGPAGIIAGVIGGVERWIAVAWGVGSYTRVACSVSTMLAGIYAAALRKFMFDNKKPGWLLSFAIGVVMEVFHLTMVFITNLDDAVKAASVVKACSIPMITANALSVMLATMLIGIFSKEGVSFHKDKVQIAQTIQKWLFINVVLTFLITSVFVYILQTNLAYTDLDDSLKTVISDIETDIKHKSDSHLLSITEMVVDDYKSGTTDFSNLLSRYHLSEISIIDENGIITESTDDSFVGFDMNSGEQSAEFLVLLDGQKSYVQKYGPISMDNRIMRKFAGVALDNGFIQVGYDGSQYLDDLYNQFSNYADCRHIGETGYIIISDSTNHRIVTAPKDITDKTINTLGLYKAYSTADTSTYFPVTIKDVDCFCRASSTEGFYIFAIQPKEEAMQSRNLVLYVNTFMEVLTFGAMFALIYLLIKKVVVNNIYDINNSLSKISSGNLNVTVDVRSNEEFASLSDDINSTVDTLKSYIDEAAARLDKELEFAKNIQSSALPAPIPESAKRPEFEIFALMATAKEVGGDFYDYYLTDKDTLCFLIADVSGKGIPAAMFMMRAKTQLKSLTETGIPLNEVFTRGNESLCAGNDAGMFVTAWMGMLDLNTGLLKFVNAGHNPPLLRHKDGTFDFIKNRVGFVLAGMEGIVYKIQEIQLEPGDIIYLYTDGVTEATDAQQELFGDDRLKNALNTVNYNNMESLCHGIFDSVNEFVGEAPQFDDITMVAMNYNGCDSIKEIHFDEASISDIPTITEFMEENLEKWGCPMKTVMQLNIALDEIYSNIVKFAYGDEKGPATVRLEHSTNPNAVTVVFSDSGMAYNPLKREDPDITKGSDERDIGGLGIFIVKKSMDEMYYEYRGDQNILKLYKKF